MSDCVLSEKQIQVIDALSEGSTLTAAAALAGIHRNTIASWRRNHPGFRQSLAQALHDRAASFRERTVELVDPAIQAIRGILEDPQAPASIRLKAALSILHLAATPPQPESPMESETRNASAETARGGSAGQRNASPVHNAPGVHNPAQSGTARTHNPASLPTPLRKVQNHVPW